MQSVTGDAAAVSVSGAAARTTRRALLLRDSLTFLALLAAAVTLYVVTLFLFRSFEAHREELAVRWSNRGRAELAAGHPAQAITYLRAALSYAPDERAYLLLLAQALAGAGHTEEASNYFLNLWEARPGDGFLNLQLARLRRQSGDAQQAINYYRSSIYGGWQANGLETRRAVRLELADYLLTMHDPLAARAELLISVGNTPDTLASDLALGDRLAATGDPTDALSLYRKAVAGDPHNRLALERAGSTAYALGDYSTADHMLRRALQAHPESGDSVSDAEVSRLARDSSRLLDLSLSSALPAGTRAEHLHAASRIAQSRLADCLAHLSAATPNAAAVPEASPSRAAGLLLDLRAHWKLASTTASQRQLLTDPVAQDSLADLIGDTEQVTATACGAPAGDDALLLRMAHSGNASDRP